MGTAIHNARTDAMTALSAMWPWIHAWMTATSDGAKRTAWLAETATKMVAQMSAIWKHAKPDAPIVLSATWPEDHAWKLATSDGVKTTAEPALRTQVLATMLNGLSAVRDVLTALSATVLTWIMSDFECYGFDMILKNNEKRSYLSQTSAK